MTPRRISTLLIALALVAFAAGCGTKGADMNPIREGIAAPIGGLDYNVYITRQINPKDVEDSAYFNGTDNGPECATFNGGAPTATCPETLFGVFVQVCNDTTNGAPTPAREPRVQTGTDVAGKTVSQQIAGDFSIEDSQGGHYEPLVLPTTNVFAYRAQPLAKGKCIPQKGSAAFNGPTGGALLVFRIPVSATENRPLELNVSSGGETRKFELDI
jgi:hypothetical protein